MLSAFSSKKGVSPLIATILLIAFAVALGSVVINCGLNINFGATADKCKNIEIKIRNIDSSDACYGGVGANGYINFVIDNTGSSDINGLTIWIIGDKDTKLIDIDSIIKKNTLYDKSDKEINYDFSKFGNIKEVQFIPKVEFEKKIDICTNNAVKAQKISACS